MYNLTFSDIAQHVNIWDGPRMYVCTFVNNYVIYCHLGWRTLVLKCNKNNYD